MTASEIQERLWQSGVKRVYIRPESEFGQHEAGIGPAIHHIVEDEWDIEDILYSVERDGFETVVCYLVEKQVSNVIQLHARRGAK